MKAANIEKNTHAYLKACRILSSETASLKYKRASEYMTELESNFTPEQGMPSISADELTQMALVNQDALSSILENSHFSDQMGIQHLTQLANHSLKAAFHILYGKQFLKKFDKAKLANSLKAGRYQFISALAQNRIESYTNE